MTTGPDDLLELSTSDLPLLKRYQNYPSGEEQNEVSFIHSPFPLSGWMSND